MPTRPVIAITGVTGYIGARLADMATSAGSSVLGLSRKPAVQPWVCHLPFDLKSGLSVPLPQDITALVHLAAYTTGAELSAAEEINAASLLLDAASRRPRCRFVFVSSQVARPDAPTRYGRVKAAIEEMVLASGGYVVRLGLVYGREEKGLFGALCRLVRKIPILPALLPEPMVQPVHVDDVCAAILRLTAAGEGDRRIFNIAEPDPLSFTRFLQSIARHRIRRERYFVPFPAFALTFPLRVGAAIAPALRPLRDRLHSLVTLRPMDTRDSLTALDLSLRDLDRCMTDRPDSRLRMLVAEGAAILRHVAGQRPPLAAVKLYVRAAERMKLTGLSARMVTPWRLRLVDGAKSQELRRHLGYDETIALKLSIAAGVAEANPQLLDRFLLRQRLSFVGVMARIGLAGAYEAFWIGARTICELHRILAKRVG